jgi:hypothetical protein
MRVNIERTLAVGVSQELLNGFDIFSIRLQQGDDIRAALSILLPINAAVQCSEASQTREAHCRGIFTDSQFFGTLVSSYADNQGASEGRSNPAAVDHPQV